MIARSAPLGDRTSLVFRIDRAIALLHRFPTTIFQSMFRVAIAEVFWSSGIDKNRQLAKHRRVVSRRVHGVAAAARDRRDISATFELSCSSLIFVGLATRLATLPLLGMIFVIEVFVYPEYWAMHLMWASILLFLLTKGPGAFSIDYYAKRTHSREGFLR